MTIFGNKIQNLAIYNHPKTSNSYWANLNRIVNEYCNESLSKLMGGFSEEIWSQF